ncbi:hypothetical protein Sps_04153 [Shewanella psychrophila]|uniref:Lipoprotein n=1 Tax=Shewanella psychrophila TaxID=225848 RepID=A0A1S6HUU9_9GAMM|nr:hypothetical protein [Shewanella psychrophila]AQS39259.1 hypothetical protein Sps_04153 [Shewanella psychrophila]
MNKVLLASLLVTSLVTVAACNSDSSSTKTVPETTGAGTGSTGCGSGSDLSADTLALNISNVPESLSATYSSALKFNRYTLVLAPNGKPIHLIAQDKLSDNQIVRARSILIHYLTNYPGSEYGSDKSAVANKMADNGAILLLLNGQDDGTNPATNLGGQPLYQNEIQVEGGSWYINQTYGGHRDASFEEILHLLHDYGIGVDQNPEFIGALADYQAEIRSAQITALNDKLWGIGMPDWIAELTPENSLTQEYLASVVDSYYGLWGAWSESATHGMWGGYVAKTRSEILNEDPLGAKLMDNKFFHPYLTYDARIDASFEGDFSLKFNSSLGYTHHAQYLKDVTLTGDKNTNVIVNGFDNSITGNTATNIVFFSGNSSEYTIDKQADGSTLISDMVDNRDGINRVTVIELAGFSDSKVAL